MFYHRHQALLTGRRPFLSSLLSSSNTGYVTVAHAHLIVNESLQILISAGVAVAPPPVRRCLLPPSLSTLHTHTPALLFSFPKYRRNYECHHHLVVITRSWSGIVHSTATLPSRPQSLFDENRAM